MTLRWHSCAFDKLGARELHDILRLRSGIFQIEQHCLYADIDGEDPQAIHLFAYDGDALVAAARLFAPDTPYKGAASPHARIGRVVVAASARGQGLGHQVMRQAVARLRDAYPACSILLSAQAHLASFYAHHGFVRCGDIYQEDDIPHVEMILT